MPALTFESNKINFSLSYDTLTFYPKYKTEVVDDSPFAAISFVLTACGRLEFVKASKPTTDGIETNASMQEIDDKIEHMRYIHRDADDHELYHKDGLDKEVEHCHLNFHDMLSGEQLGKILDIFMHHGLITADEKAKFLDAYALRYANARNELDAALKPKTSSESKESKPDAKVDTISIINFIKNCSENDILVNLHQYLEMEKFNYLRAVKEDKKATWFGTDASNHVIQTKKSWAMIEKAIALQMAHNIEVNCNFTPNLAITFAAKFAKAHPFFAIKHHNNASLSASATSSIFNAFRSCDKSKLDNSYEHLFQRFKR